MALLSLRTLIKTHRKISDLLELEARSTSSYKPLSSWADRKGNIQPFAGLGGREDTFRERPRE